MRKIILTAAAVFALTGPAFADMTLPAGDYPQAGAPSWNATEAGPSAFSAVVEPRSTHFSTGHTGRALRPAQR